MRQGDQAAALFPDILIFLLFMLLITDVKCFY